mgnify:CR=1 FL=1
MNFEPTTKAQPIEDLLNQLTNRTEKIKSSACVTCDTPSVIFADELSEKEYTISGMCQKCQDNFFGV